MKARWIRSYHLFVFGFLASSPALALDVNDPCYNLLSSHCKNDPNLADDIEPCTKELGDKIAALCERLLVKARQDYRANYLDDTPFVSMVDPKTIRHAEKLGLDPKTGLKRADLGGVTNSLLGHFADFGEVLARMMGISTTTLKWLLLALVGYVLVCWGSWLALASQLSGKFLEMLIPGHNVVLILKGAGLHEAWFFALCIPGVNIPVYVFVLYRWARRFDKGVAFVLATLFVPPFLWLLPVAGAKVETAKS